jgi:hypothetical protein
LCALGEEARCVASGLDGTRSLQQVAQDSGFDLDEVESLCNLLESQFLLHRGDGSQERSHAS